MDVARSVTDQFEWSSLARRAPSFTHEWSWAQLCVQRLRVLSFQKVNLHPVYLRVWEGEHLVGCPALVVEDDSFHRHLVTLPRSGPAVLTDAPDPPDPTTVAAAAVPDLDIAGGADPLGNHPHLLDELTRRRTRSWSLTDRDLAGIRSAACWGNDHDRDVWVRWVTRFWRASGWRPELVTHLSGAGSIVGWTIRAHRPNGAETAAVLVNGTPAHPWMSHRLRS